ncbi:hypothetical protein [Planococcus sp. YIM B11945]|uniref:hypothetical protein n=1 Tax=Planococcus sp. YIM B11945 TaxID=3435410 RepID=UPI003D7CF3D8
MYKEHLEQKLQWTKEQIQLLGEMELLLQQMKDIAVYAADNTLSVNEIERLNAELNALPEEYGILEAQRHTLFH